MQSPGEWHKRVSSTGSRSSQDVLGWQRSKSHVPRLAACTNPVPDAVSPAACVGWLWALRVTLMVSGDPRRIAAFSSVCKIASELKVGEKDSNISILMAQKTIS